MRLTRVELAGLRRQRDRDAASDRRRLERTQTKICMLLDKAVAPHRGARPGSNSAEAYGNRGNTVKALKRTESNAEFDRIRDALKCRTRAARQRPLRVPLLFFTWNTPLAGNS